jgi:hypothetical protein
MLKEFLNNMSNLSGLSREHLDLYHIWEIADNALVNVLIFIYIV